MIAFNVLFGAIALVSIGFQSSAYKYFSVIFYFVQAFLIHSCLTLGYIVIYLRLKKYNEWQITKYGYHL